MSGVRMGDILNITNGDSAVALMKEAGIPGRFLPWRDVLHEGPVPAGLSLEALSAVRAQFIAERGWGDEDEIRDDFRARDGELASARTCRAVILWFEHDLYDQLQILQILDWFDSHPLSGTDLSMICTDRYLGMLSPGEMRALRDHEEVLTREQLRLAREAWAAFRHPSPEPWRGLLDTDTSGLPYLQGAVLRLLEEYPDCRSGLSRSARQCLQVVSAEEIGAGPLFGRIQEREERIFLGDASFQVILKELLEAEVPLLQTTDGRPLAWPPDPGQKLRVTPAGKAVLSGKRNWLDIAAPDRWLGGVRLSAEHCWCWDAATKSIQKRG